MMNPTKKIGPVTLGDDVLITSERDVIYVSQDNITYFVVVSLHLSTQVDYEELGLSIIPVQDVSDLIHPLETYLKAKKIKSEDFARDVLGVSASVFSNLKRKAKEGKVTAEKMVMWARIKYFLDNVASPVVTEVTDQLLTEFGEFEVIEQVPEVTAQSFTEFGEFQVVLEEQDQLLIDDGLFGFVEEVVVTSNQHLGPY